MRGLCAVSHVWMQRSTNRGESWEPATTLSDGRAHRSRDGMPGITRLADGSLLLVFEGHWDWCPPPGHQCFRTDLV
jgi:hypothetical protein